jgi:phospholipid/cholesterol/gamma-HCH transport system substrate-binding protein
METRANYVLIGVFTLAVVACVFGFVYWFQNLGGSGERAYYRIVFDSTVSGLRTGGSVLFNGIRVGEVIALQLSPDHPERVIVLVSVDKSAPVRADSRVGLEFQGLTGIASVSISGGTVSGPPLAGSKDNPPELTADPSAAADVTQAARDSLKRVDKLVADNEADLRAAIKSLATLTDALARNSGRIDKIAEGLQNLAAGDDGKSGEVAEMLRSIRQLADNLDKRTAEITTGVNRFTATGAREIEAVGAEARRTLTEVERAVKNFDSNPSRIIFGPGSGGGSRSKGTSVPEYNKH